MQHSIYHILLMAEILHRWDVRKTCKERNKLPINRYQPLPDFFKQQYHDLLNKSN